MTKSFISILAPLCVLALTACAGGADDFNISADGENIINGEKVTSHDTDQSKSVVLLQFRSASHSLKSICSGTIISNNRVLTAAHCFEKYKPESGEQFKVIFSTMKSGRSNATEERLGTDVVIHPTYLHTKEILRDDIAIAYFENGLPAGFKAAEINRDNKASLASRFVTIYGYGKTKDIDSVSGRLFDWFGVLYKTSLKTAQKYSFDSNYYYAEPQDNNSYICYGDSGSGQFTTINGKSVIVGITSSIYSPLNPAPKRTKCVGNRSIAVKVAPYTTWIDSH